MSGGETSELLRTALRWQDEGGMVAIATVVKTWSSAPRPRGGRLVVHTDGRFEGSVSGGCVEKEVMFAAQQCIKDGGIRRLSFGVADETAWQSGLSCGGEIEVLVAPLPAKGSPSALAIDDLLAALASRRPCQLHTSLDDGSLELGVGPVEQREPFIDAELFIEPFPPVRRLVIVGATHIAQALALMAQECGFEVRVVDPREAWATSSRFQGVDLTTAWPADALPALLDEGTAVVALTHDPKIDDEALRLALAAPVRYVGALGSTRTHARRSERLADLGDELLEKIQGPIGLNIGAVDAAEIAVSILAAVISKFNLRA